MEKYSFSCDFQGLESKDNVKILPKPKKLASRGDERSK